MPLTTRIFVEERGTIWDHAGAGEPARKQQGVACVAGISQTVANGIAPEGFLILGVIVLLPLLGVVLIEAVMLKLASGVKFGEAWGISLGANAVSAVAGIPLYFVFLGMERWVPNDLDAYYAASFRFSMARYGAYFVMSVAVEYFVAKRLFLLWDAPRGWRLPAVVVLANSVTYAAVCPLHYAATAPRHTLAALLPDTAWCAQKIPLLYLDPATNYLMATDTQRSETTTFVPHAMKDYQVSWNWNVCLFINGRELWLYRRHTGNVQLVATLDLRNLRELPPAATVAMSPSGAQVAYFLPIMQTNCEGNRRISGHELYVYEVATLSSRRIRTSFEKKEGMPVIAWSTEEETLYMRERGKPVVRVRLGDRFPLREEIAGMDCQLREVYGTFGNYTEAAPYGSFGILAEDSANGADAIVTSNSQRQRVRVVVAGIDKRYAHGLLLDDTRRMIGLGYERQFGDVALEHGGAMCVLEDKTFSTLYLIDVKARKLGRLGPGKSFVLMTPKYGPGKYFQ